MASIIKNYSEHEQTTFFMATSLDNMDCLRSICKYQPKGAAIMKDVGEHLHGIHLDYDDDVPTMYDVLSSNVIELRGNPKVQTISKKQLSDLLGDVSDEAYHEKPDSLLGKLRKAFIHYSRQHPLKFKDNFYGFLHFAIVIEPQTFKLQEGIESLEDEDEKMTQREDYEVLQTYAGHFTHDDVFTIG